jgi:urea transport system permease protein
MLRRLAAWTALILLYAGVMVALPSLLGPLRMELLATYLTFALVAVGLDLIWGYAGILSIGHFAFFGIGAYGVALLTARIEGADTSMLSLFVLAGAAVAGLVGALLAGVFFALRLREMFVLVTIAFAVAAEKVAVADTSLLGGINGIIMPYWVVPNDVTGYFRVVVTAVAGVLALCYTLTRLPLGRVLIAIRDSESRAEALGYRTKVVKVVVFGLGSAIAGLGGGLYSILTGFVSPSLLGFEPSFDAVVWMMFGGIGTLWGPVIGVLAVNFAKLYVSGVLLDYWPIAIGLLFIVVVLFLPSGIAGLIHRLVPGSVRR